jgi:radical SAM superfamily enzyme YgiQ (UPF0313 family)
MKVLIISCDLRISTPAGAAYIAGAAREAGHIVEVFDGYIAGDLSGELKEKLGRFNPHVVGISITAVTSDILDHQSEFGTKYVDMRPKVKSIVKMVKHHSNSRIVLGGCGFNYYAENWLNYLNLDFGIRGEGEYSFPLFLKRMEEGGDISSVPGAVNKMAGKFHKESRDWIKELDGTAYPAYDLFNTDTYIEQNIPFGLFTKRGCAFKCTFCPHSSLEGSRYRLKSPERVISEIKHVVKTTNSTNINFCDNSFNCPKRHAEAICREIINHSLSIQWVSGAIKPLGITKDFCSLMKASGCGYVGLSIETASEKMLKKMQRGYNVDNIREALDNLSNSDIPFGMSILLGTPGETPETISETFDIVECYPMIQRIWVNIGIYLWTHHQKVLDDARKDGQLQNDRELFDGAYYISPELPENYMIDLIESLQSRKKYSVQVNKPYSSYKKQVNSIDPTHRDDN